MVNFTGETIEEYNKMYFKVNDYYSEGVEGRYTAEFTKEVLNNIGKKLLEIAGEL